jgi:hypothetical protein
MDEDGKPMPLHRTGCAGHGRTEWLSGYLALKPGDPPALTIWRVPPCGGNLISLAARVIRAALEAMGAKADALPPIMKARAISLPSTACLPPKGRAAV